MIQIVGMQTMASNNSTLEVSADLRVVLKKKKNLFVHGIEFFSVLNLNGHKCQSVNLYQGP